MSLRRPSPRRVLSLLRRTLAGNLGNHHYYTRNDPKVRRDDWAEDGDTVLLIQGFFQTRQVMEVLEARLRADGFRVLSFHLGGVFGTLNTRGIATLARHIAGKLEGLRQRGNLRALHIIGHSKGGLVARWLVQKEGGHDYVRTVVTLGTPHHGTPTAAIGALGLGLLSRSIWQLLPHSPLVRSLNRSPFPEAVRLVSVYSTSDLICPWSSSVLSEKDGGDVRNVRVQGLGHMDLVTDPFVYGLVVREILGRPVDSASGPVASSSVSA